MNRVSNSKKYDKSYHLAIPLHILDIRNRASLCQVHNETGVSQVRIFRGRCQIEYSLQSGSEGICDMVMCINWYYCTPGFVPPGMG